VTGLNQIAIAQALAQETIEKRVLNGNTLLAVGAFGARAGLQGKEQQPVIFKQVRCWKIFGFCFAGTVWAAFN